jgi:adenylate cyclase
LKHPFIGVKRELRARSLCREIEVEFLSAGDVEQYIALEFLGQSFPRDFAALIHARTEGNPLFMVDVLRYLRDRKVIVKADGDGSWRLARSLPDLSRDIPQSVSSVIDRKIDQLGDRDREVLTAAAVQGYEFDSAALAQALAAGSMEIEEILDRLERVHAFVRRIGEEVIPGGPQTVQYRFVHVLYQNALYASLTLTRRITLSAALAHALETMYGDRSSVIASRLAFLYETAREAGRASDYFLVAAQNAQNIFAHPEAIALTRRGLALLDQVPSTAERMPKELGLQITLAFSLMCTLGYGAPETGAAMRRSHELCQASGNNAALCPTLWGLWAFYLGQGNMGSAREVAEHMLSISRQLNDRVLLMGSHVGLAMTMLHQGELAAARDEFEEVERLYDVAQHSRYVQLYQSDPGLHSTAQFTLLLWLLGYPDQARRKAEDALGLARTLSSPLSLAFLELFTSQLFQCLREAEKSREMAQACITLCDEQGIQLERAWAHCWHGWALAKLGETDAGISEIRSGIKTQLSVGSHVGLPYSLAVLTDALWHAQRLGEGFEAVEDGFASARRNGDPFADLWRLKGELLQARGNTAEAESCFRQAIETARVQSAKSLELRAVTGLARLWQKQGKRTEAQHLLSEIYGWFTEGFDTADLQDAKSLLEELA